MRIIYYKDKIDRKQKLDNLKPKESMIHDDFLDKDNNPTDGNSGKLTIDIRTDVIDSKFFRMKELRNKLKDDSITFEELKEMMRG